MTQRDAKAAGILKTLVLSKETVVQVRPDSINMELVVKQQPSRR